MRRLLICLSTLLVVVLLSGCLVHHRRHHRGPPPPHRDCRTVCVQWGHKDHCSRRCRVRTNGVCMAWERRCSPKRVCVRRETRCR